jgi:hypothetical protein
MSFREDLDRQVIHIRRYRRRISRRLGREVPIEEAAERWIERHADTWRRYHPLAA